MTAYTSGMYNIRYEKSSDYKALVTKDEIAYDNLPLFPWHTIVPIYNGIGIMQLQPE